MDRLKTWLVPLVLITIACGVLPTDDGSTGMAEAPAASADDTGPSWLLGPHPVPGSTVPGPDTLAFGIAWSLLVDSESASLALGVRVLLDGRDVSDEAITLVQDVYLRRGRIMDPGAPWVDGATTTILMQYVLAHYTAAEAHALLGDEGAAARHVARARWWNAVAENRPRPLEAESRNAAKTRGRTRLAADLGTLGSA